MANHQCRVALARNHKLLPLAPPCRIPQPGTIEQLGGASLTHEVKVDSVKHDLGPRRKSSHRSHEPGCNIGSRQDDQVKLPSMLLEIVRHRRIKRLIHDFDADALQVLCVRRALAEVGWNKSDVVARVARIALRISTIRKEPES